MPDRSEIRDSTPLPALHAALDVIDKACSWGGVKDLSKTIDAREELAKVEAVLQAARDLLPDIEVFVGLEPVERLREVLKELGL